MRKINLSSLPTDVWETVGFGTHGQPTLVPSARTRRKVVPSNFGCGENRPRPVQPPLCLPVSVLNRVRYLRLQGAPNDAPWCAARSATSATWCTISSRLTIRTSAAVLGPQLGFNADDVSARSCRAGGAMALLCGRVDTSIIQLVGRWRSDVMLRCLHLQTGALMLHARAFHIIPGQDVPNVVAPLLAEVPAPHRKGRLCFFTDTMGVRGI